MHFTFSNTPFNLMIPSDFHLALGEQRLDIFMGQLTVVLGSLQCGTVR